MESARNAPVKKTHTMKPVKAAVALDHHAQLLAAADAPTQISP